MTWVCDLFEKALDTFHVKNDISYLINHMHDVIHLPWPDPFDPRRLSPGGDCCCCVGGTALSDTGALSFPAGCSLSAG